MRSPADGDQPEGQQPSLRAAMWEWDPSVAEPPRLTAGPAGARCPASHRTGGVAGGDDVTDKLWRGQDLLQGDGSVDGDEVTKVLVR